MNDPIGVIAAEAQLTDDELDGPFAWSVSCAHCDWTKNGLGYKEEAVETLKDHRFLHHPPIAILVINEDGHLGGDLNQLLYFAILILFIVVLLRALRLV